LIPKRNLTKAERLVLELFEIHEEDCCGLTRQNLQQFTGYSRTTVSAALLGLKVEGFIEVTGQRRTTNNSGRPAAVYTRKQP
tara:strand:+ start:300 stop:545 length:246 start_codon:yes stop_codon:yes gene_type:complete